MDLRNFLESYGIFARVQLRKKGKYKGCWKLHGKGQIWNTELIEKLTNLGFKDYDNCPLTLSTGKCGFFIVFVRGHYEFLQKKKKRKPKKVLPTYKELIKGTLKIRNPWDKPLDSLW